MGTVTDEQQTCDQRIGKQLGYRLGDFAGILKAQAEEAGWEGYDDATDAQYEYPLGVTVYRTVRVDISTGGPGDWFELRFPQGEDEPDQIVYHFADWFDHAERTLEGNEFDIAWSFLEPFTLHD